MKPNLSAVPVTRCCVAEGLTSQRDVYGSGLKRVYLCAFHKGLFDAADAREREREAKREVRA